MCVVLSGSIPCPSPPCERGHVKGHRKIERGRAQEWASATVDAALLDPAAATVCHQILAPIRARFYATLREEHEARATAAGRKVVPCGPSGGTCDGTGGGISRKRGVAKSQEPIPDSPTPPLFHPLTAQNAGLSRREVESPCRIGRPSFHWNESWRHVVRYQVRVMDEGRKEEREGRGKEEKRKLDWLKRVMNYPN